MWNPKTDDERNFIVQLVKQAYQQGRFDMQHQTYTLNYWDELVPQVKNNDSKN